MLISTRGLIFSSSILYHFLFFFFFFTREMRIELQRDNGVRIAFSIALKNVNYSSTRVYVLISANYVILFTKKKFNYEGSTVRDIFPSRSKFSKLFVESCALNISRLHYLFHSSVDRPYRFFVV